MERAVTVAGGTVAALVAAEALARAGRDVALYLPRKGVGGGFMPVSAKGRRLERGMRVLELRFEDTGESPPIEEYHAEVYGHRPFAGTIADYVAGLVDGGLVEVERPRMFVGGRLGAEIHLTVDLSALRDLLTSEQAETIAAEARAALERAGSDAGLLDPALGGELWARTLTEASLANHGRTFHELLIEPLCRKIRPEGGDDVPAALRRKLWMPLFYPRTVWEAAGGSGISFRPDRPFHTVEPGGPGEIVHRLMERLEGSPRVRITRIDGVERIAPTPDGAVSLELAGAGRVTARQPVLALAPGELFAAAGVDYSPDRVHSALCWIAVAEDDLLEVPSMVHVVDPEIAVFRLTAGERDPASCTRVLTLELRHGVSEEEAPAAVRDSVERLGIVREGAPLETIAFFSGRTFTAPTRESLRRFDAARASFLELGLDAEVIGGGEAFGTDALNDQILQGLRAAAVAA